MCHTLANTHTHIHVCVRVSFYELFGLQAGRAPYTFPFSADCGLLLPASFLYTFIFFFCQFLLLLGTNKSPATHTHLHAQTFSVCTHTHTHTHSCNALILLTWLLSHLPAFSSADCAERVAKRIFESYKLFYHI